MSFEPLEWNEASLRFDYNIYDSNSALNDRGIINILNMSQGKPGNKFSINENGEIANANGISPKDSYTIMNKSLKPKLVGLAQLAQINGVLTSFIPNSALNLLPSMSAVLQPSNKIVLWLESGIEQGTVVTSILTPKSSFIIEPGNSEISVSYDTQTGKFVKK